jgi:calcium/calmodulin-dependent protein kinase I
MRIIRNLCEAVSYCHVRNIAHRDVKPENLMLTVPDDLDTMKLCDFGFASNRANLPMLSVCGSPGFVAPEILRKEEYSKAVDVWSIGVIAYLILSGNLPFRDGDVESMKKGK